MHIYPSQALSKEFVGFNKCKKLLILDYGRGRQYGQRATDAGRGPLIKTTFPQMLA